MAGFKLLYHPQALKQLQKIHPRDQKKITKRLKNLSNNQSNPQLNIRKLAKTANCYRLRVGNLRVIYETDTKTKTIYVWEVDYRGSIY